MLSSKSWMLFVAVVALAAVPMAESQAQMRNTQSVQRNSAQMRSGRMQNAPRVQNSIPQNQTRVAQGYVPQHMQGGIQTGVVGSVPTQQASTVMAQTPTPVAPRMSPVVGGPSQIISETPIYEGGIVGGGILADGGCTSCGSHQVYSGGCQSCGAGCSPGFGGPVASVMEGSYFDAGMVGGGSGCGMDGCYGRGGCSSCDVGDCWINGLANIFSTGEYFLGGTGFRSKQFDVPGDNSIYDDASFGFYGGFNFGMPLCKLTCGVISGQVGIRSVSTEFDGNSFFNDNRDQTFFTFGLFRRVDYGLQFGVAADVLREEWFTETETVQIRGDLAWVYPSGSAFGFRFSNAVQDDISSGTIGGQAFTGLGTDILETYRFYYRHTANWGGYTDFSLGWSNDDHFVIGLDYDLPLSETWAMQSSLTYLGGEDVPDVSRIAGNGNEAWNLSVGFAWRPRGRSWYRSYDRPMFGVADNGSMIITRN